MVPAWNHLPLKPEHRGTVMREKKKKILQNLLLQHQSETERGLISECIKKRTIYNFGGYNYIRNGLSSIYHDKIVASEERKDFSSHLVRRGVFNSFFYKGLLHNLN